MKAQDRIETSPLIQIESRFDPTPTPYTDIVREADGKEIRRVRFYDDSDIGIDIK